MKCVDCHKYKSTFDSPRALCDLCWTLWWTEGYTFMPSNRLAKYRYGILQDTWRRHGRPLGWRTQLRELKKLCHSHIIDRKL